MADQLCICLCVVGGSYVVMCCDVRIDAGTVVMCCDVRIDAGTKCWSSGKGDYHVGHVTGEGYGCSSNCN